METRREILRAMYLMVALDFAFLLIIVLLSRSLDLIMLGAICLPTLLIFNFLFLRRKLRMTNRPDTERVEAHSHKFSVYACSAVLFAGTVYGLITIVRGELPGAILPVLLVPLSLAVYCFRAGRSAGVRKLN
jgi:hypothetical protein